MAAGLFSTKLLADSAWLLAQADGESATNPLIAWLPLILIGLALYFFAIRPQRKRADAVRGFQSELAIGDEVRTAGGIIGVITSISEQEVMVDVGGVTMRFVRGAIAGPAGSEPA